MRLVAYEKEIQKRICFNWLLSILSNHEYPKAQLYYRGYSAFDIPISHATAKTKFFQ